MLINGGKVIQNILVILDSLKKFTLPERMILCSWIFFTCLKYFQLTSTLGMNFVPSWWITQRMNLYKIYQFTENNSIHHIIERRKRIRVGPYFLDILIKGTRCKLNNLSNSWKQVSIALGIQERVDKNTKHEESKGNGSIIQRKEYFSLHCAHDSFDTCLLEVY